MDDGGYNFIYNDGDYQILVEEIVDAEEDRSYYAVHKNYKLVASFKDKKEALLWVGWLNRRKSSLLDDRVLKDGV